MRSWKISFLFFAFLFPILLAFRYLFLFPLAWGDAPHLIVLELRELLSEPVAWNYQGGLGQFNNFVWIWPIMLIIGVLGSIFSLSSDLIVLFIFYMPSLVFCVWGIFSLSKYLGFSRKVSFLATLLYIFNTYYLLLVDGGQVGVSLAYGFLPLSVYVIKRYLDKPDFRIFILALLTGFSMSVFDPRFFIIMIFFLFLWQMFVRPKSILYLAVFVLINIALQAYWIIPFLKVESGLFVSSLNEINFLSLKNVLSLYQPHWPNNIFGVLQKEPFYFYLFPVFILGSFLAGFRDKRIRIFGFIFILFVFLAKGNSPPLGILYNFIVDKIPFGFSFRDSSKFFAVVILMSAFLIGSLAERFKTKFDIVSLIIYFFILFSVKEVFSNNLNFMLSENRLSLQTELIANNLSGEGLLRSAWFPERHPMAYDTFGKPAIDAVSLVDLPFFSQMNVGTSDRFNYLNNPYFLEGYKFYGIKYLLLSGNKRKNLFTDEETANWDRVVSLLSKNPDLVKEDWGLPFPVYKIEGVRDRIFGANKLIVVLGPNPIFQQIYNGPSFSEAAFVFLEDGLTNPAELIDYPSDSMVYLFNGKGSDDLMASFLSDSFLSTSSSYFSQWAFYSRDDYLLAKYQLLTRDVVYSDLDYGRGVSFSTQRGEQIGFTLEAPESGSYVLMLRGMVSEESPALFVDQEMVDYKPFLKENFSWSFITLDLKFGEHKVVVENGAGIAVLNTIAMVPSFIFEKASLQAKQYMEKFQGIDLNDFEDKDTWLKEVDFSMTSPSSYDVFLSEGINWVVLTDTFNNNWHVSRDHISYRSVGVNFNANGFFVRKGWDKVNISFLGQRYVRWGLYFSFLTIITLVILSLIYRERLKA